MTIFKTFKSDQSGNVAMMFSVSLVAIVTGIGVALDYGQMTKAQDILQSQVDAGVLAASAASMEDWNIALGQENAKRKEIALEVMSGNGFDLAGIEPSIDITQNNTVLGRAEVDYKLAFGGLLGKDTIRLSADSESGYGVVQNVQIALVLDNTFSMYTNGKMNALKTGARNLVSDVEALGGNNKIAVVPFARYVRIPESLYTASWLDIPDDIDTEVTWQQATHSGGECHTETRTRTRDGFEEEYETTVCTGQTTTYEEQSRIIESRFDGCVGTRLPAYSEVDGDFAQQRVPGLHDIIPYQRTGLSYNVYGDCPTEIKPLSDDYEALDDHIIALKGIDQTYLPSGLLWGQYVLSAGAPFDNAESDNSVQKIMVLMTDGKNSSQIQTGQAAEDAYLAPPYIGKSQNAVEYSPDADLATLRMCDNVKAEGIEIFTIAFQVDDLETKGVLNACASDPSMAFTPETNDALIERFGHISASLKGNARLMR